MTDHDESACDIRHPTSPAEWMGYPARFHSRSAQALRARANDFRAAIVFVPQ